jgi:hypothetical protein
MIASKLYWEGDAGCLIEALVERKWLDKSEQYRLIVHDWSDHSDDAADKHLMDNGEIYADGMPTRRGQKKGEKPKKNGKSRLVATSLDKSGLEPDKSRKVSSLIPIPIPIPIPTLKRTESEGDFKGEGRSEGELDVSGGLDGLKAGEPTPAVGPHSSGGDQAEIGNPDEAHGVLKGRPELSGLTWEQDLTARKDFRGAPVAIDWVKVARNVEDRAVLAGPIDQPGSWLRVQYDRVIRGLYPEIFQKNTAAAPGYVPHGTDPKERIFRGNKKDE